jgi:hypothetical protein
MFALAVVYFCSYLLLLLLLFVFAVILSEAKDPPHRPSPQGTQRFRARDANARSSVSLCGHMKSGKARFELAARNRAGKRLTMADLCPVLAAPRLSKKRQGRGKRKALTLAGRIRFTN